MVLLLIMHIKQIRLKYSVSLKAQISILIHLTDLDFSHFDVVLGYLDHDSCREYTLPNVVLERIYCTVPSGFRSWSS